MEMAEQNGCGRVAGKVAIVTGAGGDIGGASCLRFAREGAKVVATDIDGDLLAKTVEAVKAAGGEIVGLVADVCEEQPVADLVKLANDTFGPVDILVNVVGGGPHRRLWEMTADQWDAVMRINLRSAFLTARAVAPQMMERKAGRIIMLSSGARNGTPWLAHNNGGSAYAATKAGIHGFIRNVSLELAETGVTVNAVAPGPIATSKSSHTGGRTLHLEHNPVRLTPMRRLGETEEVVAGILFLASDEASYITGVTLDVAGGR